MSRRRLTRALSLPWSAPQGLLLSFAEENFGVEMDLLPDDFSILTGGGAETSLKKQVASYLLSALTCLPALLRPS